MAFTIEIEIVAIKSGNQEGFPKNARMAQTLLMIACMSSGNNVLKIKETGVPSEKLQGAAHAAAKPVTITKGRIHGLASVVFRFLFELSLFIGSPFMCYSLNL